MKATGTSRLPTSLQALLDAIPVSRVTIQETHDTGAADGPSVALIQDVHANAEAQANIAGVLDAFFQTGDVGIVGVEGSFKPFDFSSFRTFPDRALLRRIADAFERKGELCATSYAGITSRLAPPAVVGVDDETHYALNARAYLATRRQLPALSKRIASLKERLHRDAAGLSPNLRRFERDYEAYHSGRLPLGAYIERLADASVDHDPALDRFVEAYRLERSMDLHRVETERTTVLAKLIAALTDQERNALLQESAAFRLGQISPGDYYRDFRALCAAKGLTLQRTPAFGAYVRYVLLSDAIRPERLFDDVDAAERRTIARLAESEGEKEIMSRAERVLLMEKLLSFSLTAREWDRYRELSAASPTGREMPVAESFYREADARSEIMLDRLLASADRRRHPSRPAVLITGGFHAARIERLLRDRGLSYVVLAPKLSHVSDASGTSYLSLFEREKTPLDRLFDGDVLFLKPRMGEIDTATGPKILASGWARLGTWVGASVARVKLTYNNVFLDLIVRKAVDPADDQYRLTSELAVSLRELVYQLPLFALVLFKPAILTSPLGLVATIGIAALIAYRFARDHRQTAGRTAFLMAVGLGLSVALLWPGLVARIGAWALAVSAVSHLIYEHFYWGLRWLARLPTVEQNFPLFAGIARWIPRATIASGPMTAKIVADMAASPARSTLTPDQESRRYVLDARIKEDMLYREHKKHGLFGVNPGHAAAWQETMGEYGDLYRETREIYDRLLVSAGFQPERFRFYISGDEDLSAYCVMYHNTVVISRGLLQAINDHYKGAPGAKDAVAFVLAHEIVHIIQGRQDIDEGRPLQRTGFIAQRSKTHTDEINADETAMAIMAPSNQMVALYNLLEAPRSFEAMDAVIQEKHGIQTPFGDHPALQQRIRSTRLIAWELPTLNPDPQAFGAASVAQMKIKPPREQFADKLKVMKTEKALRALITDATSFEELFTACLSFHLSGDKAKDLQAATVTAFRARAIELAGGDRALQTLYAMHVDAAIEARQIELMHLDPAAHVTELMARLERFVNAQKPAYEALSPAEKRAFWKAAAGLSFPSLQANEIDSLIAVRRILDGFLVGVKRVEKRPVNGLLSTLAEAPMPDTLSEKIPFWAELLMKLNREDALRRDPRVPTGPLEPVAAQWPYVFLNRMFADWTAHVDDLSPQAAAIVRLTRDLPIGGKRVATRTGDPIDKAGPEFALIRRTLIRHKSDAVNALVISELETKNSTISAVLRATLDGLHDPLQHGVIPEGPAVVAWLRDLAARDPDAFVKLLVERGILHKSNLAIGEKFIDKYWTRLFRYLRTQDAENALPDGAYEEMKRAAAQQFIGSRDLGRDNLLKRLRPFLPDQNYAEFSAALNHAVVRQILTAVLEGISPWGDFLLNDGMLGQMRDVDPVAWNPIAETIHKIREAQRRDDTAMYRPPNFVRLVDAWVGESGSFASGGSAAENDVFLGYLGLVSRLNPGHVMRAIENAGHFFRDRPYDPISEAFFSELTESKPARNRRENFFQEAQNTWPKGMSRLSWNDIDRFRLEMHFNYLLAYMTRRLPEEGDPMKVYREMVNLVLEYLPPSAYRNYCLLMLFSRLIVVQALQRSDARHLFEHRRAFDFEWLAEQLWGTGVVRNKYIVDYAPTAAEIEQWRQGRQPQSEYEVICESLELLLPNLVPDHRFSIVNGSLFVGDLVAKTEELTRRDPRKRPTNLPKESVLTYDPGGLGTQVDLTVGALLVRHPAFERRWAGMTADEKRRIILEYFPRPSGIRDAWLTRILKEHPGLSPDTVLAITNDLLNPMLAEQQRSRLFGDRFNALPAESTFDERLRVLLAYYPKPSYARDEALAKLAVHTRVPEEAAAVRALYFRYAGKRALTREEELFQFGASALSDLVGIMSPSEKREFLLWMFGVTKEKPKRLQTIEELYWVDFDTLPDILVGSKTLSRGMRDFLSSFFLPGWVRGDTKQFYSLSPQKGLPEDDLNWLKFITALFDSLVPQADPADAVAVIRREALWRIYKSVLAHSTPLQREMTLFNLFELRLNAESVEGLTPLQKEARAARLFLQSLGPGVTKAVGQALTELPGFPIEYKEEFELFKNDLRAIDKLVAFSTLERFLEREGGFSSVLKYLGDAEGFATLKGVWRGTGIDDDEKAVMVKRPDVEKRLEEDIRLVRAVWEDTRVFFRERMGINIPFTLIERMIGIMRSELNFDEEKTNLEALAPHVGKPVAERSAGRVTAAPSGAMASMAAMLGGLNADASASGWTIRVIDPTKTKVWGNTLIIAPLAPGRAFLLAEERRLREAGIDVDALWRDIGRELLKQIFVDGVAHIDLHAGNIYVHLDPNNKLVTLIDYGAVARLSPQTVGEFRNILFGLQMKNQEQVSQALGNPIPPKATASLQEFASIVDGERPVFGKVLDLFAFLETQNVSVNSELLSLIRGFGPAGRALIRLDWTDWATLAQYDPPALADSHTPERTQPINLSIVDVARPAPPAAEPMSKAEEEEARRLDEALDRIEQKLLEQTAKPNEYAKDLAPIEQAVTGPQPPLKWMASRSDRLLSLLRVILRTYLERNGSQPEMAMQIPSLRIIADLRPVSEEGLNVLIQVIDLENMKYTKRQPVIQAALAGLGSLGRRASKAVPVFKTMVPLIVKNSGPGNVGVTVADAAETLLKILKPMSDQGDHFDAEGVRGAIRAIEDTAEKLDDRSRLDASDRQRIDKAVAELKAIAGVSTPTAKPRKGRKKQKKSPAPLLAVGGLFAGAVAGLAILSGSTIPAWMYAAPVAGAIVFLLWSGLEVTRSILAAVRGRSLRNMSQAEFRRRVLAVNPMLLPADVDLDRIKPVPAGTRLAPFQTGYQAGDDIFIRPDLAYSSEELARVIRHEQYHVNHPIHAPRSGAVRFAVYVLGFVPLWLYHEMAAHLAEWFFTPNLLPRPSEADRPALNAIADVIATAYLHPETLDRIAPATLLGLADVRDRNANDGRAADFFGLSPDHQMYVLVRVTAKLRRERRRVTLAESRYIAARLQGLEIGNSNLALNLDVRSLRDLPPALTAVNEAFGSMWPTSKLILPEPSDADLKVALLAALKPGYQRRVVFVPASEGRFFDQGSDGRRIFKTTAFLDALSERNIGGVYVATIGAFEAMDGATEEFYRQKGVLKGIVSFTDWLNDLLGFELRDRPFDRDIDKLARLIATSA